MSIKPHRRVVSRNLAHRMETCEDESAQCLCFLSSVDVIVHKSQVMSRRCEDPLWLTGWLRALDAPQSVASSAPLICQAGHLEWSPARRVIIRKPSGQKKPEEPVANSTKGHRILVANVTLILHHHHGSLISGFALLLRIFAQWWRPDSCQGERLTLLSRAACHADPRPPQLRFSWIMKVSLSEGYYDNGRR